MAKITFVGTGDAFGSGGRMNTCFLVETEDLVFAIDFGATSLPALKGQGIEHDRIDLILLTHFHGDHAAGVPVMLMDARLGTKRDRPLTIAGPPGTTERLPVIFDALFPGSEGMTPKFDLTVRDMEIGGPHDVMGLKVTTYPAIHTPASVPTSMRVELPDGKVVAYTGDSAWTEHMPELARGSDLMIAECYFYQKPVPFHMNYPVIQEHRAKLKTKRLVLTHMGPEMLAMTDNLPEECAFDGMQIEI